MSPGLLALAVLVGSGIAAAVALYVTGRRDVVECSCGDRCRHLDVHRYIDHAGDPS